MTEPILFCTVAARNYLASVRTLCDSLKRYHPEIPRYALFTDDVREALNPAGEPFEAISVDRIGLNDLQRLQFKYDVTEFATVLKPQLFMHLFEEFRPERIIYLDPDVVVFAGLNDLFEKLKNANVLLTPHIDADFPDDGCQPSTEHMLTYGIYNLGFIGLKNTSETTRFLKWWERKISDVCTTDHSTAHYVDQKVMDLAPHLFDGIYVERDPAYNTAHWNLHSRRIRRAEDEWLCNDQPLRFFHFSGFSPQRPGAFSRANTRPLQERNPELLQLLETYRESLMENGYAVASRLPYGHGRFANGDKIVYPTRALYRNSGKLQIVEPAPFQSRRLMRRNKLEEYKCRYPRLARLLGYLEKGARLFVR